MRLSYKTCSTMKNVMKGYFFIFFYYIFISNKMCDGMLMSNPKMSDICWGNENIYVDPQSIPLLLYYFRSCLQATELLETSDKQSLLETLSRRINSILPEVKFAYYNGNINYDLIENMNDLVNEIKFMEISYKDLQPHSYQSGYDYNLGNPVIQPSGYISSYELKNDGDNSRNLRSSSILKTSPLKITATLQDQKEACDSLILKNKTDGYRSSVNSESILKNSLKFNDDISIPVPVLHVVGASPRSIAVPLKERSIYSVNSKESKDILVRYYVTSMKCLSLSKRHAKQDIYEFNRDFCYWLEKEVIPHLVLHEYYPAFSGVHQVLKTMETKGMAEDCINRINKKESNLMKMNYGKGDLIMSYYMDNTSRVLKPSVNVPKCNRSDIMDYEDSLQTLKPVIVQLSTTTEQELNSTVAEDTTCTEPESLMFFHIPSKYFMIIFAFTVALLLATWTVAGSLCFVRCLRPSERSKYFKEDPATAGGGGGCPYDPGESVIIMIKDETGTPHYYYGTFHLDKNKVTGEEGFPEECNPTIPIAESGGNKSSLDDASETQQGYNSGEGYDPQENVDENEMLDNLPESHDPELNGPPKIASKENSKTKASPDGNCYCQSQNASFDNQNKQTGLGVDDASPGLEDEPEYASRQSDIPAYKVTVSNPPMPLNSLLLSQSFTPRKSKDETTKEVVSLTSYGSNTPVAKTEDTDTGDSIVPQISSQVVISETSTGTPSSESMTSPDNRGDMAPLVSRQLRTKESKNKDNYGKSKSPFDSQKIKANRYKGKK